MKHKPGVKLGTLRLQPIEPAQLTQFIRKMQTVTFPKVREDRKRQGRNVAIARDYVARSGFEF